MRGIVAVPFPRLAPMCGIVGYVGEQSAQDVVSRACGAWSTAATTPPGIALVHDGAILWDKKAGKLANLEKALVEHPLARVHDRHRPHPLGHARRADRPQRPPAPGRARAGGADPQRDHRELRRAARRAGGRRASRCAPRPTPRSAAHLLERELDGRRRPDRGDAARVPAAAGCVHAGGRGRRGPLAGGRGPPQLARWWWGSATARTSSAPTCRRSSSTPATPSSSARTRSSRSPATGVEVTGFDGSPAEGKRYHVDWDLSAAEKDGHDWFMRKEIFEQPHAVADALLGPARRRRAAAARRDAALGAGAARRRQDHRDRLRHGVLRRPGGQVRHRALDPDPVRGRAGARVPLPRPDPDPGHPRRRDQPVRRDRGHADGDPARARRRARGCWRSATPTARRSRASPTR